MPQAHKVIYRNGAFILQTACNLPEGAEVELFVKSPQIMSPPISDLETKQLFLKSLISRMQKNPIPLHTPYFTGICCMNAVDTNILIYVNDPRNPVKQAIGERYPTA